MLRELHISNLAVIADARIELAGGLNCFTGATGAGKSLVIGAVEVLLGLRAPAEMLRKGSDEGRVSGVFHIINQPILKEIERITDVPVTQDGGEILLTRKLYASGRSAVSLNGHPITLGMLKQVGEALVDVHGQHDHQYLLKPSNQVDVLDQFGELWPMRRAYHDVYTKLVDAQERLAELSTNKSLRDQQLDLYKFQADEIDKAELDIAEYDVLQGRASVLQNLEKLKKDASAVHSALYEVDGSILERLKMMAAILGELSDLDPNVKNIATVVKDSTLQLEDASFDLSRYLDRLDLDPAELGEVHERLNTINRVLSKYGNTVDIVLARRKELAKKISELERATTDLSVLTKQLEPLRQELIKLGTDLSTRRQSVAKKIGPRIESELAELGMEKAKFTVVSSLAPAGITIDGGAFATPSGLDQVEFIAQTNPGLSAQPLRKVASGGEMSRIMLALKGILAQSDRISVLVFDEIDANVGGRLGSVIGNKLRALASHHQVLCITHLPQIASYADRHLTVRKEVVNDVTETRVKVMDGAERIQELAEMIGGQRVTDVTRAQAKELLDSARIEFAPPKAKARRK